MKLKIEAAQDRQEAAGVAETVAQTAVGRDAVDGGEEAAVPEAVPEVAEDAADGGEEAAVAETVEE